MCANAGVDASNAGAEDRVILLPRDPDASARAIRARLRDLTGACPAVVITDTFGRAWRHGQTDVAIGCAGPGPLEDWRGRADAGGRPLVATWIAIADQAAGAADLVRGKDSREPVVVVSGLERHVTARRRPGRGRDHQALERNLPRTGRRGPAPPPPAPPPLREEAGPLV